MQLEKYRMTKLYVKAASKAAVNKALAAGEAVLGRNYSMFDHPGPYNLARCPVGTVVSIYSKVIGGSPYAKAYGVVAVNKAGKVVLK